MIDFTSFKSGSSDGGNSICEMFLSNINLEHDRVNQSEGGKGEGGGGGGDRSEMSTNSR